MWRLLVDNEILGGIYAQQIYQPLDVDCAYLLCDRIPADSSRMKLGAGCLTSNFTGSGVHRPHIHDDLALVLPVCLIGHRGWFGRNDDF